MINNALFYNVFISLSFPILVLSMKVCNVTFEQITDTKFTDAHLVVI